ncbi:unnamed protein product [Effrenium voratum]|nr:unnamed protein product [Effrenium voratum]
MRVLVSITETKNLKLADLVSDLKVGKCFLPGRSLSQDKVCLESSDDILWISIRNLKTQSYVYERRLSLTGIEGSWSSWVQLYLPGELAQADATQAPAADQPQLFITLEFANPGRDSPEDLAALQNAFSKLERELELKTRQAVKKVREEADKIPWDEIAMQAKDRGISMKDAAVETGVSRSISLKEAAEDVPWHKIAERARTTGVSMKLGCILLGC